MKLNFSREVGLLIAEKFDKKEILVSGGTGLLGFGFVRYFSYLKEQFGINTKVHLTAKTANAIGIINQIDFPYEFYAGDLIDENFISHLPIVDYVIQASGYGQPGKFLDLPQETLILNSVATNKLIEKAKEKFLYLSSSEVYSGLEVERVSEIQIGSTNTNHPRAPYIEAKRFGETLTLFSKTQSGFTGNVARLALAYGPGARLDDQRVLNELILKGLRFGVVNLNDPGNRKRTYCYLDDAIELLAHTLVFGVGEIYNVGGNSTTTIRELGIIIANLLDVEFEAPELSSYDDSSPLSVSLDISKVLTLSKKTNFVSLENGLLETIEWYKSLLRIND